eukprot:UN31517
MEHRGGEARKLTDMESDYNLLRKSTAEIDNNEFKQKQSTKYDEIKQKSNKNNANRVHEDKNRDSMDSMKSQLASYKDEQKKTNTWWENIIQQSNDNLSLHSKTNSLNHEQYTPVIQKSGAIYDTTKTLKAITETSFVSELESEPEQ